MDQDRPRLRRWLINNRKNSSPMEMGPKKKASPARMPANISTSLLEGEFVGKGGKLGWSVYFHVHLDQEKNKRARTGALLSGASQEIDCFCLWEFYGNSRRLRTWGIYFFPAISVGDFRDFVRRRISAMARDRQTL